jgi:hypothetical protein
MLVAYRHHLRKDDISLLLPPTVYAALQILLRTSILTIEKNYRSAVVKACSSNVNLVLSKLENNILMLSSLFLGRESNAEVIWRPRKGVLA